MTTGELLQLDAATLVNRLQGAECERDDLSTRLEALGQSYERVKRQRDVAQAQLGVTYCAYCGAQFPMDAPDLTALVTGHIHSCTEHPMRAVERERDDANRALEMERAAHRATAERADKAEGFAIYLSQSWRDDCLVEELKMWLEDAISRRQPGE
jgi:hypothetical protein